MSKDWFKIPALAIAGGLLLAGCVNSHRASVREPATLVYPSGEVVVTETPPTPRTEVVGTPPDSQHVWVAGYWMYSDQKWIWIPGHWEVRPASNAVWVPGHWDKNPDGQSWVWTPGHWQ